MRKKTNLRQQKRSQRVRSKLRQVNSLPRLSVFRSNQYIYGQIIDDQKGQTLAAASEKELGEGESKKTKTEKAKAVGELLAKKALKAKVKTVKFDRGSCRYHGRVKAFAEGARSGGLKL